MRHTVLNIIGIIGAITIIAFAIFYTKEKKMNTGIKTSNLEITINPADDFFDYATLGWRRANPIPDDYTRYGTFDVLYDTNLARVRQIAETDNGKIGTLYKIAMNDARRNADGVIPVKKYFDKIDGIHSKSELPVFLGDIHKTTSAFWGDAVGLDERDSEHYLYNIHQGGIGLSRDYYFDDDERTRDIRKKYIEFIAAQLKNFGVTADAKKIYAIEERMAKSFHTKEVLRDPHANYHKMSIDELIHEIPEFDWNAYLDARGGRAATTLNVGQPNAIRESVKIINDSDLDLIKSYLKYRVILAADTFLDDGTYDISFDFFNREMSGQRGQKPKWKRAIAILDGTMGEEIGRIYVEKYFSD